MHRFFVEEIKAEEAILDAEESRHLAKVLRLKEREKVEVFDGSGKLFQASIAETHSKKVLLNNLKLIDEQKGEFGIHLAVAPTKNLSRWETFLEKATEIGIDRITPIWCEHSERKTLKQERQMRILKSAVKQSQKLKLPHLDEMISFSALLKENFKDEKYIAHCYEDSEKLALHKINAKSALVLIGPEGDFSLAEVNKAKKEGFQAVSLSKSRLRTETAAIVAAHTLHLRHD
ncbi:MAG: RsmE family RNA methyltransferase [Vicingaceae bacterium]